MFVDLLEMRDISKFESTCLDIILRLRGTNYPTEWLYKYSRKSLVGKIICINVGIIIYGDSNR